MISPQLLLTVCLSVKPPPLRLPSLLLPLFSEAGVSLINYSFILSSIQEGQFRGKHSLFVPDPCRGHNEGAIYFYPASLAGVGIVLITVSGIAWRLTSSDSPSCAAMLGFGGSGGGVCGLMGGLGDEDYANGGGGRFLTRQGGASAAAGGGGGSGGGGGGANGGNVNGHCGANRSANAQHPYAGKKMWPIDPPLSFKSDEVSHMKSTSSKQSWPSG